MDAFLVYLHILSLRVRAALSTFAAQEPVRLRAALTSLVLMAALYVPTLGTPGLAEKVATVGAVTLPILVGESTRRKVTPAK